MAIPKKVLTFIVVLAVLVAAGYFIGIKKVFQPKQNQSVGETKAPAGTSGGAAPAAGAKAAPGTPDQKTEATPLPVKVAMAQKGNLIMTLKSPGEAFTERKITIKAEVSGEVKELYAGEGRHVKENELLLALDETRYRLNLEKLEATRLKSLSEMFLESQYAASGQAAAVPAGALDKLKAAQAAFEKAAIAYEKGILARDEYEKTRKDYEMALIEAGRKKDEIMATSKNLTQTDIDIKIAQMELDKTRVRAPFAGVMTDVKVSPGEHIDAGRELFTLVDLNRSKVKAKVLESEIGQMKAGREVDLRFSAYPGKVYKGTVESISPVVNADDRTCSVFITVSNPGEEIKPGMHAEVEIAAEIFSNRLLVPQEAVLVRGGRKLVFVVEGDLAKWRYVEIGLENERYAEILDGVKAGEPVITEGHFTLAHDARVSVVK
jgi:RND family efflux transporter MFP subunit